MGQIGGYSEEKVQSGVKILIRFYIAPKYATLNIYQVCFLDGKNHFSPQFKVGDFGPKPQETTVVRSPLPNSPARDMPQIITAASPVIRTYGVDLSQLERVSHTKFLGLYIDEYLQWNHHISHCANKISSGLYAINSAKHTLSNENLKILYYSLIHPYLLYGITLWGNTYKKILAQARDFAKEGDKNNNMLYV